MLLHFGFAEQRATLEEADATTRRLQRLDILFCVNVFAGSKAGKCPEVFSEAIDDCRSSCEEEHECSGAQKCCPHPQCQASQCMDPWDLSQVQCVYLGKVYTTGQRFEPNSCTKCRCTKDKNNGNSEFGGAMCDIETCPKHTCSLQTHRKQQCCPVCDDSPPSGNGLEFVNCPASMLNDKDVGVLDVALPADKSYVLHNLTLTTKDLLNLNRQVFIRKQPDVLFFPWAESAWLINVTASSRRPDGSTDTATCVYKIQVKGTFLIHCLDVICVKFFSFILIILLLFYGLFLLI